MPTSERIKSTVILNRRIGGKKIPGTDERRSSGSPALIARLSEAETRAVEGESAMHPDSEKESVKF